MSVPTPALKLSNINSKLNFNYKKMIQALELTAATNFAVKSTVSVQLMLKVNSS